MKKEKIISELSIEEFKLQNARAVYLFKNGEIDTLLYIKESKEKEFWGITEKVINDLNAQEKIWFIILLSPNSNYLLSNKYVNEEKERWSSSTDGDYKLTATYLDNNMVFNDINQLKERIVAMRIELDNETLMITDEIEDGDITYKKVETLEYEDDFLDLQEEKYKCIFALVNCIKNEYEKMSDKQKAFIETVIGASIYYTKNHYGGKSSEEAIKNRKKIKPTPDHIIPRKYAARELLTSNFPEEETIIRIRDEYSKIYYVTKEENGRMRKYQKTDSFDPEEIDSYYEQEGIILKEFSEEKLLGKKKRKS